MSVAIDASEGNKAQFDAEFDTPTVGDDRDVNEQEAYHRSSCGFTCSPFSTF